MSEWKWRLASTLTGTFALLATFACHTGGVSAAPQVWRLTNNAGQVATVNVLPFTNSGTFVESGDSEGWWVEMGSCRFRLYVGGNIAHTSQGDHWTFVGFEGFGCSAQALGSGEGYANGNFPNATKVTNGTLSLTQSDPIMTATRSGTWSAERVK